MSLEVGLGCVVSYNYRLEHPSGELIEETEGWPFRYVHNARPNVIRGVYSQLVGRRAGDRLRLVVAPEDGYGRRDPDAVLAIPRAMKAANVFAIGDEVSFREGKKDVTARVVRVSPSEIVLDRNPALAGVTLCFDIEIVAVRRATAKEMKTGKVEDAFDEAQRRFGERVDARTFPFDLFDDARVHKRMGKEIERVRPYAMLPPFPWGQRLYGRVFEERCAQLPGDVIELGVGRGGMSLYLAQLAAKVGKRVFSHDSYEGLPQADSTKENPGFRRGDYRGGADEPDLLKRFLAAADALGVRDTIVPVKGFFHETLPRIPPSTGYCFAHLDSDLYESIALSLEHVYDRVADGGVIVVDDYFHHAQGPARAVADFCNRRRIRPVLHVSFPYSVFFVKGESPPSRWYRSLDGHCYSFDWLRRDGLLKQEVVRSCSNAKGVPRAHARALRDLLAGEAYSNADVYQYLHALGDYWDSFSMQGHSAMDTI